MSELDPEDIAGILEKPASASIAVLFTTDDGAALSMAWELTPSSARAVAAMLRSKLGEPGSEYFTDPESLLELKATAGRLGVLTCKECDERDGVPDE